MWHLLANNNYLHAHRGHHVCRRKLRTRQPVGIQASSENGISLEIDDLAAAANDKEPSGGPCSITSRHLLIRGSSAGRLSSIKLFLHMIIILVRLSSSDRFLTYDFISSEILYVLTQREITNLYWSRVTHVSIQGDVGVCLYSKSCGRLSSTWPAHNVINWITLMKSFHWWSQEVWYAT